MRSKPIIKLAGLFVFLSILIIAFNTVSVRGDPASQFTQTKPIYQYSVGGTISWTHTYDNSADPIDTATLTIVADDVDGSGGGMDGEQDAVYFKLRWS